MQPDVNLFSAQNTNAELLTIKPPTKCILPNPFYKEEKPDFSTDALSEDNTKALSNGNDENSIAEVSRQDTTSEDWNTLDLCQYKAPEVDMTDS